LHTFSNYILLAHNTGSLAWNTFMQSYANPVTVAFVHLAQQRNNCREVV